MDPLVCPGCRTLSGDRLELRTLARDGDVLACECGRRYPIVDGVPIVLADPAAFLREEVTAIVERDLPPEVSAALVEGGPDDAPYPRLLDHLSIYLDAHWGDRADPPAPLAARPFLDRIAALPPVPLAVELGCSTGRVVAELPAERVYGLDLHVGALRRARKLLAGERVGYPRRSVGRHYEPAHIAGLARPGRTVVCGDALDPPFVPGVFDRVVALNLLDAVKSPRQLLAVLDGLCAPGGEILLASPYAWQSTVMDEAERIGGPDPAGAVRDQFVTGRDLRAPYQVEDETELSWTLRRDARTSITYRTHYLRLRKV